MDYSIPSTGSKMNIGRPLLVGVLIALLLTACGSCSSGGDDPAEVVKNAMEAWERLDTDKASDYFCKEHEKQIKNALDYDSQYMGLSVDDVKKVIKCQYTDVKYEEQSREGDRAIVHVSGSAKVEYNADKYRELLKKAIEEDGQTISDEDLEFLDLLASGINELNREIEVRGDLELIKEDGKWKICDDFDIFDDDYGAP
jgi:hypothetical protein